VSLALAGAAGLLPLRAVVTVTSADGQPVTARVLPAPGRFELRYRHSYYRAEAAESFVADPDGGFWLVAVGSPSQAVLDYYGLAGRCRRRPPAGSRPTWWSPWSGARGCSPCRPALTHDPSQASERRPDATPTTRWPARDRQR
jgi:hypothetical protein